jgi:serine/threonine-protein kinase
MAPPTLGSPTVSAQAGATAIQFGPYLLGECIGRGGMAAVYKANRRGESGSGRHVVVKTILPQLAKDRRLIGLFTEEARLSTQLQHHNIVRAHNAGFIGGKPFIELEYLAGWNLQELSQVLETRGQRLPVSIALALVTEICRGLAYAHSFVDEAGIARPIIHRDVSPANVMICRDGSVKLLDFGLARLTRGETLSIDSFFGKLAYMSPEQLDRRQLDRRADVFALGTLLHELLAGRSLFRGDNDAETIRRVQTLVIEAPSVLNPEVPAALDVIVLRALMHDPDRRYSSAGTMLQALEELGAVAAPHETLLRYLGSIGPELFCSPCEECGTQLPYGIDCGQCKTQVDARIPMWSPPSTDALWAMPRIDPHAEATPPRSFASITPKRRRRVMARLTHLQLMFYVLWVRLQNRIAACKTRLIEQTARLRPRPLRLGAAIEQFCTLWACAWPRAEPRRLATPSLPRIDIKP